MKNGIAYISHGIVYGTKLIYLIKRPKDFFFFKGGRGEIGLQEDRLNIYIEL